ncbi:membrane protein, partial [Streptomyces viridochromogenes DSM 40736]
MTTCSSSPRSHEPAITPEPNGSTEPSAGRTVETGGYQVEQTSTQPAAGPYETNSSAPEPAVAGSRHAERSGTGPVALGSPQADQAHARSADPDDQAGEAAGQAAAPGAHRVDAGAARPAASAPERTSRPAARGTDKPGPGPFVVRSLDENLVELRPGAGPGAAPPYGDAVSDLVHAAVADRPLEEVVALITSLEESPAHAEARVDALRTAGVGRAVEDVCRMIALLTRHPRDADCADEAIRAAAAHRPVEEVTRLVTLLHKQPQEPHVREEALRAAATGRSVEELVELIDRLGLERLDRNGPLPSGPSRPGPGEILDPEPPRRLTGRRAARPDPVRQNRRTFGSAPADHGSATDRFARSVSWTGWLAALALAVCAVAHFPLQRGGVSLGLHAYALALSVLCTVLALLLALRPVLVVLAGAVVVPTVLAGAQAYQSSFPSASLPRAVKLALAPPWFASGAAVCAALLAVVTLAFRMLLPVMDRQWAPAPAPGVRRMA